MKNVFALTAFWICIGPLFAQKNYTPETLAKIRAVENNISGTLLLNDEGPSTIAQRMAKHKVKDMSIAVIQDYKIAWAKGYGWADESEKRPVTPDMVKLHLTALQGWPDSDGYFYRRPGRHEVFLPFSGQ